VVDSSPIDPVASLHPKNTEMEKHDDNPLDGIWIFIVGDLFIFGSYFVVYALWRHWDSELFLQSQQVLSQPFGIFNTLVLLGSSWFIAAAIRAMRAGDYGAAGKLTWMTIFLGLTFVASKLTEWVIKIGEGYTFTYDIFFQFYYFMTGVHILHVFFGMLALGRLLIEVKDPECRNNETAEACAAFWHMVDLLWLIIFALMYLMR